MPPHLALLLILKMSLRELVQCTNSWAPFLESDPVGLGGAYNSTSAGL